MKKALLILFTIALFTGCENEPIDSSLTVITNPSNPTNPTNPTNPGSESSDLTLSLYELDTDISFSLFGTPIQTVTNSDINITNNVITSSNIELSVQGSTPVLENQTITRNGSGQVISDVSTTLSGAVTNEYFITYTSGNITEITYNYYDQEDPSFDENYTYNFTYSGNTITRTKVGSSIETLFSLNTSNKLVKKESFDNSVSILAEELTYNSDGNISNSITTGESEGEQSYNYDALENPLKTVYDEHYLLNFLSDEYEDEIGSVIAHFHASKNWTGVTINGDTFNFTLNYNTVNRISSRDIAYNFEGALSFIINERFNYVN
ncbi:hypothetical protein [Lacinutrix jangbogonensis]|uniref:hypothetical protein n=1 Tax=Lacinutrix jangbogonensis TaxID=1469557 RepID=UPI00053EBE0A|nr:hypothetical protein [Lacinutrix jangbogonensis]